LLAQFSDFILGCIAGLTGLIPFIHTNTIIELTRDVSFNDFGLFAVALVFSRLCFEFLANVKFEIATEQNALSIDGIKQLNASGREKQTLKIMIYNALLAMLISFLLYPIYSIFGKTTQQALYPVVPIVLIGIFVWFTLTQDNKLNVLIISLLAGICGIIVLEKNIPNALFILLTGLYAVPSLLEKSKEEKNKAKTIEQNQAYKESSQTGEKVIFPLFAAVGSLIGMTSAFFPAMTPTMLCVTALFFLNKQKPEYFLALNAAILGSRAVSDFAALEFLSKGRSGATAAMLENNLYNFSTIYSYLVIGIVVAIVAAFIALKLYRFIPTGGLSRKVKIGALIAIFGYVFYTASLVGVIAMATCSLVGLTCNEFKVGRAMLGSSILFPSVKNYL